MIWLAKVIDALSPILFALLSMLLVFLIVNGGGNDAIAFGTGRLLVYVGRAASPVLYWAVLLLYGALFLLCSWLAVRTFKSRRRR